MALANREYDADYVVTAANAMGAKAVIAPRSMRANPRTIDKDLYKERNLIERMFNKLGRVIN